MPDLVLGIHVGPIAHPLEQRPQPHHLDGRDKISLLYYRLSVGG
jgi:hypothetical protein